jgi:hypothetical protein
MSIDRRITRHGTGRERALAAQEGTGRGRTGADGAARPRRRGSILLAAALLVAPLAGCADAGSAASADPTTATTAASPTGRATDPAANPATDTGARWRPRAGLSWQWQLTTPVDTTVAADVYDIDADENPASVVAALHGAGRRVVCYVNAGGWEPYRPDAKDYPKVLLGKALDGWPDERWLDIRRLDLLTPLLAHRLDACRAKGFDAVEPDNVDGYQNDTGFPLTSADQLAFDRVVARLAHQRGLAVALKNDFDQVAALQPDFDFAVDEQCAELHVCPELSVFVKADKPVFDAEYSSPVSDFCAQTRSLGISAIRKHLELDAWRQSC